MVKSYARMDVQIDSLYFKRQEAAAALQAGDLLAIRQLYWQDRRLMSQVRFMGAGAIIFRAIDIEKSVKQTVRSGA